MLQRKLILNLGPLVVVLVITAVTAILMLQNVLGRLDHQVGAEQQGAVREFRWIVVGLGLTFVVVINLAIIVLVRVSSLMAEDFAQSERRRMEVLSQAGIALNHELNNAMAAIELQLGLLSRRAGEDATTVRRLRTIHDGLTRMKETVQSLKSVRRIVLTEYGQGLKMLDLVESARVEAPKSELKQVTPV